HLWVNRLVPEVGRDGSHYSPARHKASAPLPDMPEDTMPPATTSIPPTQTSTFAQAGQRRRSSRPSFLLVVEAALPGACGRWNASTSSSRHPCPPAPSGDARPATATSP